MNLAIILLLFLSMVTGMKQITFLRHGCTYMNEYLGRSLSFGAPHFTDAAFEDHERHLYHDTPLSPLGERQARALQQQVHHFEDLELLIVSPLRRALQTMHIGLSTGLKGKVPILAHPAAAERLYLISDVGSLTKKDLEREFDYVDFTHVNDEWWYHPSRSGKNYVEWRPTGQSQKYACPGEPQDVFEERMKNLRDFLRGRPETKIGVVCHHGVIDHLIDRDFDNCQFQTVNFDQLL